MEAKAVQPASGPKLPRIVYRLRWLIAALVLVTPLAAQVQEELPQIMPGERKTPTKKDLGPRALGLLRLTASGKASFVPIAIMINGKFWDAAAYKAAPVPMALETGTVYEVERAGNSQGLFTVGYALHSNAASTPTPWLATGEWLPAGKEAQNQPLKAQDVPVGINDSDAPPRLTRDPSRLHLPVSTGSAAPSTPASKSSSSDEPPRLTKPKDEQEAPANTAPAPTASPGSPTASSGSVPSPPAGAKPADHPESAKAPESDSGATDANRPRLRRGKPTGALPDDEIPGYSKPGAASSAKAAKSTATQEPVQLIPAISDAGGPDAHSYTFEWLKGEEEEKRQAMATLAKQQLRAYLAAQAKARISATSSQRHASAAKLPEPILENDHMTTYDLWMSNQPVLVYSADAHLPTSAAGTQEGFDPGLVYSIVLVAYPDIYNNLHKLYVGVTDKFHLDVTPRLELIDAVDADGDGRGELLFRETSDAGTGWVIYRATADTLWKMYDSLNPE